MMDCVSQVSELSKQVAELEDRVKACGQTQVSDPPYLPWPC